MELLNFKWEYNSKHAGSAAALTGRLGTILRLREYSRGRGLLLLHRPPPRLLLSHLPTKLLNSLSDPIRRLRGHLLEIIPLGIGILLGLFSLHLLLTVRLIAEQQHVHALISVALDFGDPEPLDVFEGGGFGHVVDDHDAVDAFVVRRGDRTEALLPGCVPDLEFYVFALDHYVLESGL